MFATGTEQGEALCVLCGQPGANKTCSRCKAVNYCSRACQVDHWKTHKLECQKPGSSKARGGLAPNGTVFVSTYTSPAHSHIGFVSGEFELQTSKMINDHPYYIMKEPYNNYPLALWYCSDAWVIGELPFGVYCNV